MKENKTNCGVYKIKNIENGKCYIGSSVNLWSRKNQHFNQLKQGNHGNRYLQNSYNLNGKDNFEWSILKYINKIEDKKLLKNELIEWENYYIGDYRNKNIKLYNIREIAESNLGIETRKKLEVINLDTLEIFDSSLEAGIKYSVHKYDVGKVCRGERITSKGYKWAYYEDYLNNNLKERKDLNKRSVINLDTEEIFDSIKDASSIYNICINNIWEACQNKRLHTGGYKWSYYKENMDIKNKINNIDDMLNKRKEKNKLIKSSLKMSERTKERLNESKYKKVINLTTGEIFNSIKKAEEFYNIKSSSHISRVCKGKQKTAYGYRWAYHNEV